MKAEKNNAAGKSDERALLFLHICKTAGISVSNLLRNRFAVHDCLVDVHRKGNDAVDPNAFRFVTGHVAMGYAARFTQPPLVFTLLREPVERALSEYCFLRSFAGQQLRDIRHHLPEGQADELLQAIDHAQTRSMLDFLEGSPTAPAILSNLQTRCLLTFPYMGGCLPSLAERRGCGPADPHSHAALLAEAERSLRSCVVGVTERLQDSLDLLTDALGGPSFGPIPHDNRTRNRLNADDIDPRALSLLQRWNQLDMQLYRHAEQIIDERLACRSERVATTGGRLPEAATFTLDQPVHGRGWHPREKDHAGWYCWMSERIAWIDLQLPRSNAGDHTLICRVRHEARPRLLHGLRLAVNNHPLEVRSRVDAAGTTLTALVPARLLADSMGRVRISFALDALARPCDLNAGSSDARQLGIALGGIQLRPCSGLTDWLRRLRRVA